MQDLTEQEKFWKSDFGQEYTGRNNYTSKEDIDAFYMDLLGVTRSGMNEDFLDGLNIKNILEVGCNIGNQLNLLQTQGYKNLYGIEIQSDAVERAKEYTKGINIVEGSAFDLPFRDNFFDLVFTAGVLIHISPDDIGRAMDEIYRVSDKYIWGYEYFSEEHVSIDYRGNDDRLWKADFAKLYVDRFSDLKLVKEKRYPHVKSTTGAEDTMYLLEKRG
jgi:pseudaminic acid biosynthesis-associated methylase